MDSQFKNLAETAWNMTKQLYTHRNAIHFLLPMN